MFFAVPDDAERQKCPEGKRQANIVAPVGAEEQCFGPKTQDHRKDGKDKDVIVFHGSPSLERTDLNQNRIALVPGSCSDYPSLTKTSLL